VTAQAARAGMAPAHLPNNRVKLGWCALFCAPSLLICFTKIPALGIALT
jgi:hypothetical protein